MLTNTELPATPAFASCVGRSDFAVDSRPDNGTHLSSTSRQGNGAVHARIGMWRKNSDYDRGCAAQNPQCFWRRCVSRRDSLVTLRRVVKAQVRGPIQSDQRATDLVSTTREPAYSFPHQAPNNSRTSPPCPGDKSRARRPRPAVGRNPGAWRHDRSMSGAMCTWLLESHPGPQTVETGSTRPRGIHGTGGHAAAPSRRQIRETTNHSSIETRNPVHRRVRGSPVISAR